MVQYNVLNYRNRLINEWMFGDTFWLNTRDNQAECNFVLAGILRQKACTETNAAKVTFQHVILNYRLNLEVFASETMTT